ncbi:MAG: MurR/RpiR family transcriptional regulator [Thermotaleaceae bacterium]
MKILKKIAIDVEQFSNKQKLIAKYLMQNKDKIGFMTLRELSEAINVTEVTILNFCKTIGLDSFSEMKKEFQEIIKKELHVPTKIESSLQTLDNLRDAFENTIQIQKMNFERIIQYNSLESLQDVGDHIGKSRTVYICGVGVSKVIADYLHNRLKLINIDSRILDVGDMVSLSIDLSKASQKDCFILISFPSYSPLVINLSRYLIEKNMNYIAITDNEKSPLAKESKILLKSYNESLVFYNFISSTISLIELVLIVLSFNMKDKIMENIEGLEEVQDLLIKDI